GGGARRVRQPAPRVALPRRGRDDRRARGPERRRRALAPRPGRLVAGELPASRRRARVAAPARRGGGARPPLPTPWPAAGRARLSGGRARRLRAAALERRLLGGRRLDVRGGARARVRDRPGGEAPARGPPRGARARPRRALERRAQTGPPRDLRLGRGVRGVARGPR